MADKQNILVTGHRRSGTTFIGRMLSINKSTSYIHEPLNYEEGIKGLDLSYWFPYLTYDNVTEKQKDTLDYFFALKRIKTKVSLGNSKTDDFIYDATLVDRIKNVFTNITDDPLGIRLAKILLKNRFYQTYLKAKLNPFRERLLLKDPLAALSSNFLAERYNLKVLVTLRHPAAYFYSMKKPKWGMDPDNFLAQKDLMDDYLMEFKGDLERAKSQREKALLEWICIAKVLFVFLQDNDSFIPVKHEAICLDPLGQFEELYKRLGLTYNKGVEKKISNFTSANRVEGRDLADIKRNSEKLVNSWKEKLSNEEIDLVKEKTYPLAKKYYPENEWI